MLCAMPSLRQSSAMLVSPRNPSRTMRIFSSAEYCRRVALRMSLTVFSALSGLVARVGIIVSFGRDDEPKTLRYTIIPIRPVGPDEGHSDQLHDCGRSGRAASTEPLGFASSAAGNER